MALPTSDNTVNVTRFSSTLATLWTKIKNKFATKADLASPTFTGTPTMPTTVGLGQAYVNSSGANSSGTYAITASNFSLSTGGVISIRFTENCPASAKLNVNSKGSKDIYFRGAAINSLAIKSGDIATFQYDGTRFQLLSTSRATEQIANAVQTTHLVGASGSVSSAGYVEIASIKCQQYCDSPYTFELYPRHYPVSIVEFTLEGTTAAGTVMNAKHYVTDTSVPEVGYTYTDASSVRTYHLWIKRLRDDDSLTVFCKARSANKDYVQIKNWGESSSASAPSGYVAITKVKTLTPTDVAVGTNNGQLKVNGTDITVYTHPTQTAYTSKGTATKVPQITTDSTGHITSVSEVTISGVTPSSHASTATTYGIGTTSNYGHVKLATGDMNGATNTDGVAVSKNHTHSQYAPKASPALTGTPTAPTAADGTNTTQIATTAFVQSAVAQGLSVSDAMVYKGTITLGATSPGGLTVAADKGHTYKVVANGNTKEGYVDGVKVEAGDMVICNTDSTAAATSSNYSTIAAKWDFVQGNTDGVVVGPASATSGNVVLFDGATGKLVKDGGTLGTAAFKSVTDTYSSTGTDPVSGKAVAAAINALDVTEVGGDGKYIKKIKEDNGKITATVETMDTTPTASSTKAVTSGGIKTALDGKADDDAVVHKAGEETITGNKVFKNGVEFFSPSASSGYGIFVLPDVGYGTKYTNWDSSLKDGAHFREWTLHFPAGVNFWGRVRITFLSGYSNYNASGCISKTILCAFNGSTVFNNTGAYDALGINTETEFRISDLIWDNTNGYWTIKIHSIKPSSDNIVTAPRIEFACRNDYVSTARQITWSSTSPSIVTDTTYYTKRSGNAATAPTSSGVLFNWDDKPVFQSPYGYEIFDRSHTIPVSNGGTGKTTVTAAEYNLLSHMGTDLSAYAIADNYRFVFATTSPSETNGCLAGYRTAPAVWSWIKGKLTSDTGVNISGNAATATSANITRTADTTNGDKLQIGSGTAVNVVNSKSTLNVAASAASTNTSARHIWFSDSSTETKRAYSGDLTYRTDYNRITAHVSGYSTGLNKSNTIQHQQGGDASTFQYKVHRIATFPQSGITTQGGSADESLVLQLFTKGYNKEDYGIVLITVKLAGTVSNNPTVNVRWKLRSAAMPTDAVQAAFIKDGNGLWHVDVFFIIQHSYQLTVFNKLGSFSPADPSPQGGWTLISSEYDASKTPIPTTECYTDISGTASTTASKKLYNADGYVGAATGITDDGIVGTANTAKAYDTSFSGTNSIKTALTSHNHGLQISTKRPAGVDANSFSISMGNYNGTNTWKANLGLENKNIDDPEPTFWLASIRSQKCTYTPSGGTATSLPWYAGSYSPGITFGGKDTKGVISLYYDQVDNYGKMTLAAGNGKGENGGPNWWFSIRGLHNTTYILPPMGTGDNASKYAISIVGTAGSATVADKLANGAGGIHQPVYIPASGTYKGIPQAIGLIQKSDNQYYVDMPAERAYAAVAATSADKAGSLNLADAVGSETRPVYFNAQGAPVMIRNSNEEYLGNPVLDLTVSKARNALYLNGYSLVVGSYGGVSNTIYFS